MADFCELLCLDLDRAERIRGELPGDDALRAYARRARALGDPTRLALAAALRDGELCGCDLAWITGRAQNLVSHHLKALREPGLVASRREGKIVFFALTETGAGLVRDLLTGEVTA